MSIDERPVASDPVASDEVESRNRSGNRPFQEVVEARLSRRAVVGGGIAAAGFAAFLGADPAAAWLGGGKGPGPQKGRRRKSRGLLGFDPIPASSDDTLTVPDGYTADVLIPWGTPLLSSGPAWKKDASNTAAEAARQIGMHHDGMHFFPKSHDRGVLVVNHEYVDRTLLYPDGDEVMTAEKVDKALASHGVSVVEIELIDGQWQMVDSEYNHRITGATQMAIAGPVPWDHPELQSELGNPVEGTLNNCAHGYTPWWTYLACEENFHGYFGTEDPTWEPTESEDRYGLSAEGFGYRWHLASERFNLAANRKEVNRFGWVVEIDPFKPGSKPAKRTALGRFRHESATHAESRGRAVVYTGDDARGEYFYKFVGKRPWKSYRNGSKSPLDEGTLYVAKLEDDGTGTWLPLEFGKGPLTAANGWQDQADVLIRTRQAADAVEATPLDRPEWVAVHPETQDVFVTLTNGNAGPNGPNPRNPNPYGHILKLLPDRGDHTRTKFRWDVWVLAGDPAYDDQVELDDTNIFGSPDGLWVDPDGRLWIQTDISNSSQNRADRGYDNIGNNAMLAADPETGEIKRFLVGPRGCEITGVITTPDQKTMFINVQHPGESTAFWGDPPTPENPRAVSNWPDFDPEGRPRAATVVIRKEDGGTIGT